MAAGRSPAVGATTDRPWRDPEWTLPCQAESKTPTPFSHPRLDRPGMFLLTDVMISTGSFLLCCNSPTSPTSPATAAQCIPAVPVQQCANGPPIRASTQAAVRKEAHGRIPVSHQGAFRGAFSLTLIQSSNFDAVQEQHQHLNTDWKCLVRKMPTRDGGCNDARAGAALVLPASCGSRGAPPHPQNVGCGDQRPKREKPRSKRAATAAHIIWKKNTPSMAKARPQSDSIATPTQYDDAKSVGRQTPADGPKRRAELPELPLRRARGTFSPTKSMAARDQCPPVYTVMSARSRAPRPRPSRHVDIACWDDRALSVVCFYFLDLSPVLFGLFTALASLALVHQFVVLAIAARSAVGSAPTRLKGGLLDNLPLLPIDPKDRSRHPQQPPVPQVVRVSLSPSHVSNRIRKGFLSSARASYSAFSTSF
ncbi:hypothetical protein BGZ61DRAFT_485757 [Ilyonectria robusta]|uniref:uncharacterized protein n=1 Tax=Ilyonectria robusta TaxID=1079257 RepID=UPI001E8E354F|nr:uncharacterized protein BGZ61DRAFT_485757 [Ilyonectria robusta]KAH8659560.1 hypothetical protein BGZ61DRAFT_485757 [Ilyonectria robusta]